jgi:type III secretion protein L
MVIWLRSPYRLADDDGVRLGANSDVVPRETFGALMHIEAAYVQLDADRQQAIVRARAEADALIAAALEEATRLLDNAKREYDAAAERGYRDGEQRAVAQWLERLANFGDDERRLQVRMRERLARIVTVAVEQIVQVQHAEALFERALDVVDRIVEGATYVRVSVSPDDHDKACMAFERLSARWRELGRPFPLTVVADRRLAPGSCICESDFGAVDASLTTQLSAMRTAVARALKRSLEEAGEEDAASVENDHEGDVLPGMPGSDRRSEQYAKSDGSGQGAEAFGGLTVDRSLGDNPDLGEELGEGEDADGHTYFADDADVVEDMIVDDDADVCDDSDVGEDIDLADDTDSGENEGFGGDQDGDDEVDADEEADADRQSE